MPFTTIAVLLRETRHPIKTDCLKIGRIALILRKISEMYVEMKIPEFLVFKIRHFEKFPGEDLFHPPASRRLLNWGNQFLQKPVEIDFGF
jgi:hypothetical protein